MAGSRSHSLSYECVTKNPYGEHNGTICASPSWPNEMSNDGMQMSQTTELDVRQAVAGVFDRAADTYDAVGVDFFGAFARRLLDEVRLAPGERVLDVGCGRGAVFFPAAEQVGDNGSVTGIDLAAAMVARTADEVCERGLTNATVAVMDAQQPVLPTQSYDVVVAAFVAFFLPDPVSGLRAWCDLLVPGGRLGLTSFGGDDPRWDGVKSEFGSFLTPAMIAAMTNPDSPFASTESLDRALTSAGFSEVTSVVRQHDVTFHDPEQWIAWSWSHGQRMFWELVPAAQRAPVHTAVLGHLEKLREPDGSIVMSQLVRYTTAHRR
jgi:ubiquinone/menaquinone biosynthesis C-methylase UbiE